MIRFMDLLTIGGRRGLLQCSERFPFSSRLRAATSAGVGSGERKPYLRAISRELGRNLEMFYGSHMVTAFQKHTTDGSAGSKVIWRHF
jgi:hypothetical protein